MADPMNTGPLEADEAQLRQFFNAIFKRCGDVQGYMVMRAFEHEREGPAVVNQWVAFDRDTVPSAAMIATDVARREGERRAVFAPPVAIFGNATNDKGNRFSGEANVICAPAIAVELDEQPQESLDAIVKVIGEPTLVIASGGTWEGQPKLHAYWRLGEPAKTEDAKAALKAARKMATRLVDGDGTAVALSHPMRWPGSWHTKGEPRMCEIVGGDQNREIKLQWAVEALDAALLENGLEVDGRGALARADRKGFRTEREWSAHDLERAATAIPNDDVSWDQWNVVGMSFYDASHGSPDGLEAFIRWSEKSSKGNADEAERRWKHYAFSPPTELSAAKLTYLAREADPDFVTTGTVETWFEPQSEQDPLFPENSSKSFEQGSSDVFEMLTVADIMSLPPPRYLIDRHIVEQSTCIVYGDPGAGKSFLALDWALHLAGGLPDWHGDEIEADEAPAVVYIAGEGVSGYQTRIRAWLARHPEADPALPGFRLVHERMNFTSGDMVAKLIRSVRRVCGRAAMIIVDTVAKATPGAEENSTKEMGLFVGACVEISKQFRCAVVGVHHTNKMGGMRGSSAMPGGVDTIFKLERKKGSNTGYLMCEKQKDGPGEWAEPFQLETVCVGVDHKGKPVSSLVVSKTAVEVQEATTQAAMLDALDAAWQEGRPWSDQPRSKERYAPRMMHLNFNVSAEHARQILSTWLASGVVVADIVSAKSKTKGLRRAVFHTENEAEGASETEEMAFD